MRRRDLNLGPGISVEPLRASGVAGDVSGAGYVYVLATTYHSETGSPIVKIGMTRRTPDERAKELSRGGPTAMKLEGFVTSRDARALERLAHQNFARLRYSAGGGREYFAARPAEILTWLRAASPRFELESARESAWKEYCETVSYTQRSRIMVFPVYFGGACFWVDLLFWHPNAWGIALGFPAGLVIAWIAIWLFLGPLMKRLDVRCAEAMTQLEEKYHLPPGEVRAPV